MIYPECSIAVSRRRKNPMKTKIYRNRGPLNAMAKKLGRKIDAPYMAAKVPSICGVCITTIFLIAIVQPALAQQTVLIGSQSMTPEVTINLSAIYSSPNWANTQNFPSMQPNLASSVGVRQLLVPNLRMAPTTRAFTSHPPAPSREPIVTSRPALVVTLPRKQIEANTKPAAPALPPKSDSNSPAPPAPTAVSQKPAGKATAKFTPVDTKPKPATRMPKAPVTLANNRLAPPPPPPPPTVMGKAETVTPKAPDVPKVMAKKPKAAAARPVMKATAKLNQMARLTPAGDNALEVRFRSGSSVLTRDDERRLKVMVQSLAPTETRLQLKAYAEATGNDTSKARRLSLSRALAVRSFLIENGLRSTRIDVRALGIARDGGAPDRVDIVTMDW